ncbi:hypothetical protein ACVOMV_14505 [Mesorhizobium atlanticum]
MARWLRHRRPIQPRLGLFLVIGRGDIRCLRRATASLFLGTTPRLGLGLQARFFLGLTARGSVAPALAAFLFLGAALGIFLSAQAILGLASLGAFQRPAARFISPRDSSFRTMPETFRRRRRRLRRFLHDRRGRRQRAAAAGFGVNTEVPPAPACRRATRT